MEVLLAEVDEDGRIMCVHRSLTFSYKRESTKQKFLSFFLRNQYSEQVMITAKH
jgi:hypothetical protein